MDADDRDRLRHAVHNDNTHEIKNLGWAPVFEALERMWAKRMDRIDRLAYATVLGTIEPKQVLDAILDAARDGKEWRPKPPELAARLGVRGEQRTNAVAVALPLYRKPETLRLVGDMLVAGGYVCVCTTRSFAYVQTVKGILMCSQCGGLERGQAEDAIAPESRETTA